MNALDSATTTHFHCGRHPYFGSGLTVFMHQRGPDGFLAIPKKIEMESLAHEDRRRSVEPEPFLQLDTNAAQQLMDALFDAGVRPSSGQGSAGQLAAVQTHLHHTMQLLDKVLPAALQRSTKRP